MNQETEPVKPKNNLFDVRILIIPMVILIIIFIVTVVLLVSNLTNKKITGTLNTSTPSTSPSVTAVSVPENNNVIEIKGLSMSPNFLNGEYYSVDRSYFNNYPVRREDVVLLALTMDKYGRITEYVKRVVGIPNDSLKISSGKVYLNGNLVSEPYLAPDTQTTVFPGSFINEGVDFTIPQDKYLVLGDNRTHSSDSREWGYISKSNILGKILKRIENYIPPTSSPERVKIEMKYDLMESITQKLEILKSVKEMCSSLSSYQNPQIICALENELKCNLNEMSIEQLQPLSQLAETAITDCIHHQDEIETKRSM